MSGFNTPFQQTVAFFMTRFGADALLIRDDGTGTYVNGDWIPSNTNISVRVLPFDYLKKSEGTSTEANTLIRSGDKQVFIQPQVGLQSINPASDKLNMNGVTYKVVAAKNLNPSLVDSILFELYVRE